MVYLSNVSKQGLYAPRRVSFGKKDDANKEEQHKPAQLLYEERETEPWMTGLKIQADRTLKAFTTYSLKGMQGSKNSNFYETLTVGTVPYLIGSGMIAGTYSLANRYFSTPDAVASLAKARNVAGGVALFGILKNLSKKFIEVPIDRKYGIDISLPYKQKIDELPEERNKNNLTAYEYHDVYDSVDFPRFDLLYDNEYFGEERDDYFREVGLKMGIDEDDLEHADQKVRPLIKEKVAVAKSVSAINSGLWGAVGVGMGMQGVFSDFKFNPLSRASGFKKILSVLYYPIDFIKTAYSGLKRFLGTDRLCTPNYIYKKCNNLPFEASKAPESRHFAGRALFGAALGTTLLGNFLTLNDFNKDRGSNNAATSLIDDNKKKVVC